MHAKLLSIGLALVLGAAPAAGQTRSTPAPAATLIDLTSASRDALMALEGICEVARPPPGTAPTPTTRPPAGQPRRT